MDATLVPPYKLLFPPPRYSRRINMQIPRYSLVRSVLTDKNMTTSSTTNETKHVYKDNWFDLFAINHLSQSLQASTGLRSKRRGYDGLVEAATMASQRFNPIEQRKLAMQSLCTIIPGPILSFIKRMNMPPSKFTREQFAFLTTIFLTWLVGPSEVRESDFDGRKEKNVVYIPKCRFLEGTNCVGMCTNLCKIPTQAFIKDSMGMPTNMVPNFDDMSCEMRFGEEPPLESNDPAFTQPCYKQCKVIGGRSHNNNCTS